MKTNKNIDRLFQEKLKDFEVSPPDAVWNEIEQRLKNKKSKPLLPFWFRVGSVAAIGLLIIISSINYYTKSTKIGTHIITNTEKQNTPKNNKEDINTKQFKNNNPIVNVNKPTPSEPNSRELKSIDNSIKKKKKHQVNHQKNNIAKVIKQKTKSVPSEKSISSEKNDANQIALNSLQHKNETNNTIVSDSKNTAENKNTETADFQKNIKSENKNTIANVENNISKDDSSSKTDKNYDDLLQEDINDDIDTNQKETLKRWSVASLVAPVYYNSFNAKGSPLDTKFENSPKKGSKTVSYGVQIGYKFNNKLSLQSGVSLINVGYKIGDIYINPSQQSAARLENVNYLSSATILNINSSNYLSSNQIETSITNPMRGVLNQEFGYLEIPLELKYNLLGNKKQFGINLISGFSTLILNSNDVYVETSEFLSNLGEANNLNKVNFSGNLGLDIDYKINKKFYFNIAPMLKIHTNTFSKNDGSFKPYVLGVYTGLNYNF